MAKTSMSEMVSGDESSKELAIVSNEYTAPVQKMYSFGASVEFDPEDIKPPHLKLCHGQTKEVQDGLARPGQFIAPGFDAIGEVTLVPLGAAKSRGFVYGEGDDYTTFCRSSDAKWGRPNLQGVPGAEGEAALPVTPFGNQYGGACAACPMSRPQPNPKNPDRKTVPCTLAYSFACYCVELNTVVEVQFRKTGTKAALALIQACVAKGMGNFAFMLASKQEKGSGFTYFVPIVVPISAKDTAQEWLDKAMMLMPGGVVDAEDGEVA